MYMDRYEWVKDMTLFSTFLTPTQLKQILFFDGYGRHFNDCGLCYQEGGNIQPLLLKSGDSSNDHNSNNGTNGKLKSIYNGVKSSSMLKYGIKKTSPHHMNLILVE